MLRSLVGSEMCIRDRAKTSSSIQTNSTDWFHLAPNLHTFYKVQMGPPNRQFADSAGDITSMIMYMLMVVLPGMVISGAASWWVKSAFKKYSNVASRRGITGAQAAQMLLDRAGISDVQVVATNGYLSDHYNPRTKQLALSEPGLQQQQRCRTGCSNTRSWPCDSACDIVWAFGNSFDAGSNGWHW